jgi:membrane associated rhomboid family serine protease
MRSGAGSDVMKQMPLTVALIAINVVVYILQTQYQNVIYVMESHTTAGSQPVLGSVDGRFALWGPMVSEGEWYRLLTCGFLHASVLHIGLNMLSLFFLGRVLEPALGALRFGLIYFVSLVAGSLGVMIAEPQGLTLGASGAIFGLAGALLVISQSSGIGIMQSGIGPVVLLNLAFTFTIPGISIGGHLGGLAGGAAITYVMVELAKRRRSDSGSLSALVGISAAAFIGLMLISVMLARSKYPSAG